MGLQQHPGTRASKEKVGNYGGCRLTQPREPRKGEAAAAQWGRHVVGGGKRRELGVENGSEISVESQRNLINGCVEVISMLPNEETGCDQSKKGSPKPL